MNSNIKVTLTEIMFELTSAAVLDKEPNIPKDIKINWSDLLELSTKHGLLAWVWDGICKLPINLQPQRQLRISWGLSAQEIWGRYARQKCVLTDLVSICNQNSIRLLLLKGLTISELFPNPHSRPSGDIDIFLFEDYKKGNKLFLVNNCSETDLHTSFVYKNVEVENHKNFVFNNSKTKSSINAFLFSCLNDVVYTTNGYYEFSPLPNLTYLLIHAMVHVDYTSSIILPAKNILDIGFFIFKNKNQLPPTMVFDTMKQLRLDKSFDLIVFLAVCLYGINLKEYSMGLIKKKDLITIHDLFKYKGGLFLPIKDNNSIIKYSCALWKRYFTLRPFAKYIFKNPRCGLLMVTIRKQISYTLRCVFLIQKDVPLRRFL